MWNLEIVVEDQGHEIHAKVSHRCRYEKLWYPKYSGFKTRLHGSFSVTEHQMLLLSKVFELTFFPLFKSILVSLYYSLYTNHHSQLNLASMDPFNMLMPSESTSFHFLHLLELNQMDHSLDNLDEHSVCYTRKHWEEYTVSLIPILKLH